MNLSQLHLLFALRYTCLAILLIISCHAKAGREIHWDSASIDVGAGTITGAREELRIQAGADGKAFVSVAPADFEFDNFSRIQVTFGNVPLGTQCFLLWRNSSGLEGLRQFEPPADSKGTVSIALTDEENWKGTAQMLGIGFALPPYASVSVKSITLWQPSIIEELLEGQRRLLRDWSALRPWQPADINAYTGTTVPGEGVPPVPLFAATLLGLLLCYIVFLFCTAGVRHFNWHVAGALTLVCWIALDLLWQARLGQQAALTYRTFAGKSASEKLLASDDSAFVQFIARVKQSIKGETPRIFLASANDYGSMLSAYYIAPLNTYWHRGGPELPDRQYLSSGDYILLVTPFATRYEAADSKIRLPDDSNVPVEVLVQEHMGALLRVI